MENINKAILNDHENAENNLNSELNLMEKLTFSSEESTNDNELEVGFPQKKSKSYKNMEIFNRDDQYEENKEQTQQIIPIVEELALNNCTINENCIVELKIGSAKNYNAEEKKKSMKLISTESKKNILENKKILSSSSDDNKNYKHDDNQKKKWKKFVKKRFRINNAILNSNNMLPSSDTENSDAEFNNDKIPLNSVKMKLPQRISAKEAEEQMQIIQSESQRMARKNSTSIHYHRPKQHSLTEFLNRKIINKPQWPLLNIQKAAAAIKMSREELEIFASKLNDRAKESKEFYRNESDSDDAVSNQHVIINSPSNIYEKSVADISSEIEIKTELPTIHNSIQPTCQTAKNFKSVSENVSQLQTNVNNELPDIKLDTQHRSSIITDNNSKNHNIDPEKIKSNKLKELVTEMNLKTAPIIHGDRNSMIDLDSGVIFRPKKSKSDIEKLFDRFLKHTEKRKINTTTTNSLVNTSKGIIELKKKDIKMDNETEIRFDSKPRAPFFRLKEKLSETMAQKRYYELKNKICDDKLLSIAIENKKDMKKYSDCETDDDDDEKEGEDSDGKEYNLEDREVVYEDSEEIVNDYSNENRAQSFIDIFNNKQQKQRKRIISLNDSDDESEKQEFANQNVNSEIYILNSEINTLSLKHYDTNHLYSQNDVDITDSQLLNICSGTFDTQLLQNDNEIGEEDTSLELKKNENLKLIFESSCTVSDGEVNVEKPKTKRKINRLRISDDEDETQNTAILHIKKNIRFIDECQENNYEDILEMRNHPTKIIDYDSEENEMVITQHVKERANKYVMEFIENEAELSESDLVSDDEDEKGLDHYDVDGLVEEEKFDQNKLQTDLSRIHMLHMFDQDKREVKIIQKMLIEENEQEQVRERKFRWKNLETNLSANEMLISSNDNEKFGGEADNSDDENEEHWRKMRHQRQQTLKQNKTNSIPKIKFSTLLANPTKITTNKCNNDTSLLTVASPLSLPLIKDSPFLIDKTATNLAVAKTSLLNRDKQTLFRLATSLSKPTAEASTDLMIPSIVGKTDKLVFSTLSLIDKNASKRKNEIPINANQRKKTKTKEY